MMASAPSMAQHLKGTDKQQRPWADGVKDGVWQKYHRVTKHSSTYNPEPTRRNDPLAIYI